MTTVKKTLRRAAVLLLCFGGLSLVLYGAGFSLHPERYSDFITRTPLEEPRPVLVIGFLGGREPWNSHVRNVRLMALHLRDMDLPGVHVETVENARRRLAVELVKNALDRNRDGRLDPGERTAARIIVYGQSLGGSAAVQFARELNEMQVPVQLTVQVDSVGFHDGTIPPNVACAANLYQPDGIIHGEPRIRAEDPARTTIIGNFEYEYRHKEIDLSRVSWVKRVFRVPHTKMDFDPEVWSRVEQMVLYSIHTGACGDPIGRGSAPAR